MTDANVVQAEEQRKEAVVNPPATEVIKTQPLKRNSIIIMYSYEEKLITPLDNFLQLTYRRLGPQIDHGYFGLKKITAPTRYIFEDDKEYQRRMENHEKELQEYRKKFQGFIRFLKSEGFLLVLCVSNSFIDLLDKEMTHDPDLRALFENPPFQIMPVLIHPTVGVSLTAEPLCVYQEGSALDSACRHIADSLEAIVRNHFGPELEEVKTAWDLLHTPGTIHINMPSVNPRDELLHCFVEQISARIVDAQKQIQDERSQRLQIEQNVQFGRKVIQESETELRNELGEIKQQLAAIQNAGFFTKIGRLFKTFP